jgi:hypothetical protein
VPRDLRELRERAAEPARERLLQRLVLRVARRLDQLACAARVTYRSEADYSAAGSSFSAQPLMQ